MKKMLALSLALLLLAGCGGMKEMSVEGTVFSYGNERFDMTERVPEINAAMFYDTVGSYVVVQSHINPKNSAYSVFDTKKGEFVKDIIASNMIWRDNDISTAVYTFKDKLYNYEGDVIGSFTLNEHDFVGELSFDDVVNSVLVTIMTESSQRVEALPLPEQKK